MLMVSWICDFTLMPRVFVRNDFKGVWLVELRWLIFQVVIYSRGVAAFLVGKMNTPKESEPNHA